MNPAVDHRLPPHPHRPSFSCDLHPSEKFNGFCPSCLCDRLTTLHPSAAATATSSLFRRTKSFSASKGNSVSSFEPQRRSCDVRVRAQNDAGGAQSLDHNVGDESRDFEDYNTVRVPVEDRNGSIGEKIRIRVPMEDRNGVIEGQSRVRVPIEAGRDRTVAQNVGDEIRDFEERISNRVPVEDRNCAIEEKFRVGVPSEAGRAQNLAQKVCEELRAFKGKIRVRVPNDDPVGSIEGQSRSRVPIEACRAQNLAQKVCEDIRGFEGKIKVRVPSEDQILSIEEEDRVRVPIETGRAQTLGYNVGDKIRAFEEKVSPIEGQLRVRVPIEAGRAQLLGHNMGGEIRPFEEKIRVCVPIESRGDRTESHNVGDEIRVLEEEISPMEEQSNFRIPIEVGSAQTLAQNVGHEIRGFEEEIVVDENTKSMRDYIDLDFQAKKKKHSVGFWSAASVFSKKWSKWMKKQKAKKHTSGMERTVLPLDKPTSRKYRETQSEVADYGFGRRSCDMDPRFSIDVGRLSIDGPPPSFDPPRASWDGHMLRQINYSDRRVPGDTLQTHQYYLDTSSRRRRSFDRSRNNSLVIGAEVDEMKLGSNAKVTPETFDFHQRKSNSLRDECSEIFELGIRDDGSVIGNVEEKGSKRDGRWVKRWSFLGLIYRRNKYNEDDRSNRRNSFDRSSVRGNNGIIRGGASGNMYRRSTSVSLANSYNMGGVSGSVRHESIGENGLVRKKRDDLILERNRSVDNGLLRFNLTPPRSNNRVFGSRKSSGTDNSRSIPKGVYRY